jgi:hypothetical protein
MQQQYVTALVLAAALVVVALLAWALWRRRRTATLSSRFGPEYERTVTELGKKSKAEAELAARARRRETLDIHPLTPAERDRYLALWRTTQARFVDGPGAAVSEADLLVAEVMRMRGYPMADFDQRAADISVDYPQLVQNYREAHRLAEASHAGQAGTEDLRQAMVHYRALFEELLMAHEEELVGAH